MNADPIVRIFPDAAALAAGAAARVAELSAESISARGRFSIAFSGGSTPLALYSVLATEYHDRISWPRVHAWLGDERCVPHDHHDSNARMIARALLDHVPMPPLNIHLVPTALPPTAAADEYERALRAFDPRAPFDLVLLGLGADGHTASLVPGSPALCAGDRWTVSTLAPPTSPVRDRVSITLPLIAISPHALFLVSGKDKSAVVARALNRLGGPGSKPPAALVRSINPVEWYLDAPAAGTAVPSTPATTPSR